MKKIVINKCYGGYGLSLKAIIRYAELKKIPLFFYEQTLHSYKDGKDEYVLISCPKLKNSDLIILTKNVGDSFNEFTSEINSLYFTDYDIDRDDPALIQTVEELGADANGCFAELHIVKIPDDVKYYISDYDGIETIEEEHRSWS